MEVQEQHRSSQQQDQWTAVISVTCSPPDEGFTPHSTFIPFALSVLGFLALKSRILGAGEKTSLNRGEQWRVSTTSSPCCKECADHHSLGSPTLEVFQPG